MHKFSAYIIVSLLAVTSFFFVVFFKPFSFLFFLPPLASGLVLFVFAQLRNSLYLTYHGELDAGEEQINIIQQSIDAKRKVIKSLPHQRRRMSFLFNVAQQLIELIEQKDIYAFLINAFGDLFPQADAALLFIFDYENDALELAHSLKRQEAVIKDKRGGMLDIWVVRHNRSLVIGDITKDFRFDCHSVEAYTQRGARSFIISPLSIAHKIIGVMRIESKEPGTFSLEDSRLMRNISDLGAVVLERSHFFAHAQDLAIKDPLTSFVVKEHFFSQLRSECRQAKRKGFKIGIIMLDVDDFKKLNDEYGHIVGDAVLRKVARALRTVVGGAGNIISRFGGEEFIVSLRETDKNELISLAEEIRAKIEESTLLFRRRRIAFTVSVGAGLYPDSGKNAMDVVDAVDKLLYKAKAQGKNKVCYAL